MGSLILWRLIPLCRVFGSTSYHARVLKVLLSFPHFVRREERTGERERGKGGREGREERKRKGRKTRKGKRGLRSSSFPLSRQTTTWPTIMVKVYQKARRETPLSSPHPWWNCKIRSEGVSARWRMERGGGEGNRWLYCLTLLTAPPTKDLYTRWLVEISSGSDASPFPLTIPSAAVMVYLFYCSVQSG